ncbi:glutamate receptor ionotropic, delta-2-like [Penaeus chinensis]|uniref:glutamate receptor ionotropic, delta-2-like n=1 Tax=Penaeus chinensis TaxID=139456 RepID=UPI001FB67518|nr:glutamate receptor ionotropic, delta-2-like [Penaeus chinensis]
MAARTACKEVSSPIEGAGPIIPPMIVENTGGLATADSLSYGSHWWPCLGWVFHRWLQRNLVYAGAHPSWLPTRANQTLQDTSDTLNTEPDKHLAPVSQSPSRCLDGDASLALRLRTRLVECGKVRPRNWLSEYVVPGTETFSRVEKEFANATLTFATVHRPPFTMLEKRSGSSEIIKATGFCFSMLELLVKQFGFKYRLVEVPDGSFGVKDENGDWNGMVGMVVRGEADGAIGSFTVSHSRSTAIDFTAPFFEEPTGILLPKPTSGSKMTAFLAPFSWQVWIVTAVLVVVVGTLLSLLSAHFPLLYPHRGKLPGSLIQYITYTAKALLSQSNTMRQTNASRVLHSFWWLLVLTLIYSYSGTLIASLTAPKLVKIADSLEDLVNQQEVPWTVKQGSVHETLFVRAQTGIYGKSGRFVTTSAQHYGFL